MWPGCNRPESGKNHSASGIIDDQELTFFIRYLILENLRMESTQIFAQINTEEGVPYNWMVFPLQRQRVVLSMLGWIAGAIIGGLFFGFMVPIMVPHNYQAGVASAIFSTLILGLVLYVCLGSLWALLIDILRLRKAKEHFIVITPDDFLKQEGDKVIQVPLEYIQYITARGAPQVDRSLKSAVEDGQASTVSENVGSLIVGRQIAESGRRGIARRRMRTPTMLAFIDSRTGKEVVVVNDTAYGDPYLLAAHLKQYVRDAMGKKSLLEKN